MTYDNIRPGIFLARPNRFIAQVEIQGQMEICHVKNTGRCRELLVPGAKVYLQQADNPNRRTRYDLIAVEKGPLLINIDSQAPNRVFAEYLRAGHYLRDLELLRPETRYGASRFDFYAEAGGRRIFMEVKGVTLEENGLVLFPDAPTERGVRHIRELMACLEEGYAAHAVFVVQLREAQCFTPNVRTHPAFGQALAEAAAAGVQVTALNCAVTPDSLNILGPIPVRL